MKQWIRAGSTAQKSARASPFSEFGEGRAVNPFVKVLKDPVHDEILVEDPWIWQLVNTAAVQRLRRIRQLGTSYLTFHGAEHSRFTHSLGAYETMRRVLHYLFAEFGWPRDERERKLALAAALLHDVGHGRFRTRLSGFIRCITSNGHSVSCLRTRS